MRLVCNSGREIEVKHYLTAGGMAVVHMGTDISTGDPIVVKFPRKDVPSEAVALFIGEAENASQVDHPNVVRVIDWGDSGEPFIVLEYVSGGNLQTLLSDLRSRGSGLELDVFLTLAKQLCSALAEIHKQFVHRDLKPDNILVTDQGIPKIGDFGLAKYIEESTRSATFKGWGTPGYRSPELLDGGTVDARADQLALGIILWEILTAQRAYGGPDFEKQERFSIPARVSEIRPDVSLGLSAVLAKMMAKRAADRYDNVEKACQDLRARLDGTGDTSAEEQDSHFKLAVKAIRARDSVRQRELEIIQEEAARQRVLTERDDLFEYEFGLLKAEIRNEVEAINSAAGEQVAAITETENGLNVITGPWTLRLVGWPTDLSNSTYIGWGSAEITGSNLVPDPKPYCATHFALNTDTPYPRWRQVSLRVPSIVMGQNIAERGQRQTGDLILAESEEGFMTALKYKGITGASQWIEEPYEHAAFVKDHLEILFSCSESNPER